MLRIEKKTYLKDTVEYEEYSENVAKLTDKEKEELGIRTCGGCCKRKENKKSK